MPELTVDLVERFYAILAIAATLGMVVVWGLRLLALGSGIALEAYAALARIVEPRANLAAWIVALLATVGSLYFSEVARFTPCTLCWYQRIAMYPFVVLLGVASLRRQDRPPIGASTLAAVGAIVAAYHVALEWLPSLDTGACSASVPCTFVWFRVFDVISLPTLALTAFLLILTLTLVRDPDEPRPWSDR